MKIALQDKRTLQHDWSKADEISDRIIDLMNTRFEAGVDPLSLFAGQLLGLIGFMRTAPRLSRPDSFNKVGRAAEKCLREMMAEAESEAARSQ